MNPRARLDRSAPEATLGLSAPMLVAVSRAVERIGGDPMAFLAAAGVSQPCALTDYVPGARANLALERVAQALHTDCLGVHLALACPPGSLGMIDFGLMASGNLEEWLQRTTRWYQLVTQLSIATFDPRADPPRASLVFRAPQRSGIWAEFVFGALILRVREALGGSPGLEAVHFRHAGRAGPLYESLFAAPVHFHQPLDSLFFKRDRLSVPFLTANPATAAALDEMIARTHAITSEPAGSLSDRAKGVLVARVSDRAYDVPSLARHLGLSPRTLQRRLRQEGSSQRALVDAVRRQVALELVVRRDLSPEDVASRVGFAGPRAFYRAFSRWTGMTPAEYRARHPASPRE